MLLLQEIPFSRNQDRAWSAAQEGSFQPQPLRGLSVPAAAWWPPFCCWGKGSSCRRIRSHWWIVFAGAAQLLRPTRGRSESWSCHHQAQPLSLLTESSPLPTSAVPCPCAGEGTSCLLFLEDTAMAAPTGLLSSEHQPGRVPRVTQQERSSATGHGGEGMQAGLWWSNKVLSLVCDTF